jgi:hypothetical protein
MGYGCNTIKGYLLENAYISLDCCKFKMGPGQSTKLKNREADIGWRA